MFDFIIIYCALFVTLKSRLCVNLIVGRARKKPSLVIGGGVGIAVGRSHDFIDRAGYILRVKCGSADMRICGLNNG